VNVLDGNHILQATSVTVGPASFTAGVGTSAGVAQLSVPWTPIYAGSNQITVQLVSGLSGETLPGVGSQAAWNLTVYFFYDTSNGNANSWTHSQTVLQQTNVPSAQQASAPWPNPQTNPPCFSEPTGNAVLWGQINVPVQWPIEKAHYGNSCSYKSSSKVDRWGMNTTACFQTQPFCASLSIGDGNSNASTITWSYSSNVTLPAGISSATATWWQKYNLATSASGGIVCIVPQSDYPLPSGYSGGTGTHSASILNTVFNLCQTQNPPSPGYSSPQAPALLDSFTNTCNYLGSFSGASLGGSGAWQQENLNLTAFAGQTVSVAFGFIEGTLDCGGTANIQPGNGWNIDDFSVQMSGGTPAPVSDSYASCQAGQPGLSISSDLWEQPSASSLAPTLSALGVSAPPTGSAWVAAANDGGIYTLNPNMWDSLYSRPIDLSDALNATIHFNYLWSDVFWVNPGVFPYYDYGMSPQQDFVLQVSPAVSSSVSPWTQIWSADNWTSLSNGHDAHSVGTISGSSGLIYGGQVRVAYQGWQSVSISLDAYVGEVIQLRFLVGTNCGYNSIYAEFNYPMISSATGQPLPTGAFLSGVNITGATVISAGSPSVPAPSFPAGGSSRMAWTLVDTPAASASSSHGTSSRQTPWTPRTSSYLPPSVLSDSLGIASPASMGLPRWA
jgi:hypothetical protein